jgi:8-oxo-dGTP diphosphatase
MAIGRFCAGIAALIWSPERERYLLLKRSPHKDFAAGAWECVTGRVDQGESFERALRREVHEEVGVDVQIDFVIGTTHFYRGDPLPENELLGVVYSCTLDRGHEVRLGPEHSEFVWASPAEASALLIEPDPSTRWLKRTIARAERIRALAPQALLALYREWGFALD